MALRKKTPRWWWLMLAVVAISLGGLWYWGTTASESSPTVSGRPPTVPPSPTGGQALVERLPVKTLEATKRDLAVTLPVFGAVTYLSKVEVASEIQGVIKQVLVEPGDVVRKNQVLAVLDTELLATELRTRSAMRAQAEALLHQARWQYQARQKLYKVGGASLSATEEAEAQFLSRLAEVQRYVAEVAQIRAQIQKSTIRAPIAGVVASRNFNVGEKAPTLGRQEDKGLITLMRLDEVYVRAEVSERELARLRPGLEVIVVPDAYPSARLPGRLERLEPVLKEESRTVTAKVRVPNPDYRLKPGMFARLEIVLDKTPQVVAVPKSAFQIGPDKAPRVFVVVDEVAFLRQVVPGAATENWVEIKEGLKPEEKVVVEGAERLKDLARVVSSPASAP